MSEEEKKEIRRKQQERALKTQAEIDKKLKQDNKMSCGINITQDSDDEDDDKDDKISNKENNNKSQIVNKTIVGNNNNNNNNKDQSNLKFEDMLREYEQNLNRENNSYVQDILQKNVPTTTFKMSESKKVKWLDDSQATSENSMKKYFFIILIFFIGLI